MQNCMNNHTKCSRINKIMPKLNIHSAYNPTVQFKQMTCKISRRQCSMYNHCESLNTDSVVTRDPRCHIYTILDTESVALWKCQLKKAESLSKV